MSTDFIVVNVRNLKGTAEEFLSQWAFEEGAMGISEVLPFNQPEGEEDVFTQIPDRRSLDIYFQQVPNEFVLAARSRWPEAEVTVRGEANRDWLAEWKKGFAPFALVDDHWVVPSWCHPPAEATHRIWIDPGMAFGTGTHETTQLVAREMKRLKDQHVFKSCLDVGTGTGILAVLAKQLGVSRVAATEIEADSRRVAKETFMANKFADIALDERQIEALTEKFDLVVANIIDGVLVRVQETLKARVKPGGWLVVSGIILEREKDFLSGFNLPAGTQWAKREQQGDWVSYSVML